MLLRKALQIQVVYLRPMCVIMLVKKKTIVQCNQYQKHQCMKNEKY